MSASIFTPTNQKRLTNVAVVRLTKNGKRFEIACYKNKVLMWRDGTEKDKSEVFQVQDVVFTNVSKGEVASKESVKLCFGTCDMSQVCLEILNTGDLQVTEKERKEMQTMLLKQISTIIMDKCVDNRNHLPPPQSMVLAAIKKVHYSVNLNESAKKQALYLIPKLEKELNIKRADMVIRITISPKEWKMLKNKITELMIEIQYEDHSEKSVIEGLITPGNYKVINDLIQDSSKGKGFVFVVSLAEVADVERSIFKPSDWSIAAMSTSEFGLGTMEGCEF